MPNKEFEDIKKILHNYNLLDDYFIDQDSTTSTGEINATPIDDAVFVGKYKDITNQKALMESAVDKIFRGYNAAYDKGAYKAQFDIYPMRDFDEHMASLGAKRSANGIDFEPVGKTIDWVAVTKTEIAARLAEREKIETEAKIEKAIEEASTNVDKIEDQSVAVDIEALKESLKKSELFKESDLKNADLVDIVNKLLKRDNSSDSKYNSKQKAEIFKWVTTARKNSTSEEFKEQDKVLEEKNKEFTQTELSSRARIDELKKQIEANKLKMDDPNNEDTEDTTLLQENEKLSNMIKAAEQGRSKIIKGITVTEQQLKDMHNTIGSDFERKTTKYDGFTTIGPFCKEKRDYFINVFRPSISHIDTEFRESVPTKVAVKDVGNDIIQYVSSKGGIAPKEPTVESSNTAGFDNKTIAGVNENNRTGNADMNRDGKMMELKDYLKDYLHLVMNMRDGFKQIYGNNYQDLNPEYKATYDDFVTKRHDINVVDFYYKCTKKNSLVLNKELSDGKSINLFLETMYEIYQKNLQLFNKHFESGPHLVALTYDNYHWILKKGGLF